MSRRGLLVAAGLLACVHGVTSFVPSRTQVRRPKTRLQMTATLEELVAVDGLTGAKSFTLSTVERARTVAQSCTTGTLCTLCQREEEDGLKAPFGSHVDYVLNEQGAPVMLLSDQSLHTKNMIASARATLYAQMPIDPTAEGAVRASMARVSVIGKMEPVEDMDEIFALRTAYSVAHTYADRLIESPKFAFWKLVPERVYYVGGFGVQSAWVDTQEYEVATADILALESNQLVDSLNANKEKDLRTLCVQFLGVDDANDFESVRVVAIDRLGMDLRVTTDYGRRTDEYRVGFLSTVLGMEDAKSEIYKTFQEAWEKEQGYEWEDMGPPIQKYAEDIMRS